MQTSAMRRRTKQTRTDTYSPKDKSNSINKPLFIILSIVGGLLLIFILYKLLSSPSQVTTIRDTYDEQEVISSIKSRANEGKIPPHITNGQMGSIGNRMPPNFMENRAKLFQNKIPIKRHPGIPDGIPGINKRGGFTGNNPDGVASSIKDRHPEDRAPHAGFPERPRANDRFSDNLKGRKGFGDLSNLRGMFNKGGDGVGGAGGIHDMLNRRYDRNGDGPIFNDLNRPGGGQLSPEEMQQARDKMRENMRGIGSRMGGMQKPFQGGRPGAGAGFPFGGGRPQFPRPGDERREEM